MSRPSSHCWLTISASSHPHGLALHIVACIIYLIRLPDDQFAVFIKSPTYQINTVWKMMTLERASRPGLTLSSVPSHTMHYSFSPLGTDALP